jgi:hypothetical protein
MNDKIHLFTSITSNYLPKARVLAESAKRHASGTTFHLVLADDPPPGFDIDAEPFDNLILAETLPVEDQRGWFFSHSLVELCTAVKGLAVEAIFDRYAADKVFYFDPDMVLFGRFDELATALDQASVVLTPHQTDPELTDDAIMDNEMGSLQYGVFNLGFLGVRNDSEGRRFSRWWRERLLHYCHDDLPHGLFTDQKWVNLAPCFFDNIKVLRSPAFNVATWNITRRKATGSLASGVLINGEPLGFYHFSGFDSGAQELMLNKYGADSPVLFELREWYINSCRERGQDLIGKLPSKFAAYDDGTPISRAERELYRKRLDLRRVFPDPFSTQKAGGYQRWYADNVPAVTASQLPEAEIQHAGGTDFFGDLADWLQRRSLLSRSRLKRGLLSLFSGSCRLLARGRGA